MLTAQMMDWYVFGFLRVLPSSVVSAVASHHWEAAAPSLIRSNVKLRLNTHEVRSPC